MSMNVYLPTGEFVGAFPIVTDGTAELFTFAQRVAGGNWDSVEIEPTGIGASFYILGVWFSYAGRDADGEKIYMPWDVREVLFCVPKP